MFPAGLTDRGRLWRKNANGFVKIRGKLRFPASRTGKTPGFQERPKQWKRNGKFEYSDIDGLNWGSVLRWASEGGLCTALETR